MFDLLDFKHRILLLIIHLPTNYLGFIKSVTALGTGDAAFGKTDKISVFMDFLVYWHNILEEMKA